MQLVTINEKRKFLIKVDDEIKAIAVACKQYKNDNDDELIDTVTVAWIDDKDIHIIRNKLIS